MGELDKAAVKLAEEKEVERVRRETAIADLNEKLSALQEQEGTCAEEMRAHADACAPCADSYVRNKRLAYELCPTADNLGTREHAIRVDQAGTIEELTFQQSGVRPPKPNGWW